MNENEILDAIRELPSISPTFLTQLEQIINESFFDHYDSRVEIEVCDYPE